MTKKFILGILMACFFGSTAIATDEFRKVKEPSDIQGCWKRLNFSEKAMKSLNQVEPYPLEHQWYCFLDGGKLFTVHSNRNNYKSSQELIKASEIIKPAELYQIPQEGVIVIGHSNTKERAAWISSISDVSVQKGSLQFNPGDLLMTIRDQKTGKDIYYRFLTPFK